jgi:diaminohydroxyphosphoribosylaminopyrimidine deaminase/5-amino-6-(5-phosphoribosylamino)uracil reductase
MSTAADQATGHAQWLPWLERAARIALRGHGGAEPNPMVGCVILDAAGRFVAEGHHRRCGGPHAEVEALCRAGERAQGGTAIVTLEPCNHHGRTGPCSHALRDAGVARVVYACSDPHEQAAGGAAALRAAGVQVLQVPCEAAQDVAAPFLHRVRTGLPWVVAKWAQTLDGHVATRSGDSKWISSERSRALVHRQRARVDAILTGIGTVLRDDPQLTVRGTRARRVPVRVVWDPQLDTPMHAALVRTAREVPTVVVATPSTLAQRPEDAARLSHAGVDVRAAADPRAMLAALHAGGASTVLVEAGGGLVGRLLRDGLVNDLLVFVAPLVLGDDAAPGPARGESPTSIAQAQRFRLLAARRRGDDVLLHYRAP